MSALGQKRTWMNKSGMSASHPRTVMPSGRGRYEPNAARASFRAVEFFGHSHVTLQPREQDGAERR